MMSKKVNLNLIYIFLFVLLTICSAKNLFARDFYWENVERITKNDSRFPSSVSSGNTSAIFWQQIDSENKQIWLSTQVYEGHNNWRTIDRFAGPFSYSGEIPDIYSAAILPSGKIAVAVLSDVRTISVFISENGGYSYRSVSLPRQEQPLVAPRIYTTSDNSFMIFTSLGQNESFSMLSSKSSDGYNWESFAPFAPSSTFMNPFIPVLVKLPVGDLVVFQAQYNTGTRLSYQLYSTLTSDGGVTWSTPQLITGASSLKSSSTGEYFNYNNQRASLFVSEGKVFVAWERTYYTSGNANIWVQSLDMNGLPLSDVQELTSSGNANRPVFFNFENTLSLVWFDTRSGSESVYLAQKQGFLWDEITLSSTTNSSVFAFPVLTDNNDSLAFIWQVTPANRNLVPYISRLAPDRTVSLPTLSGVGFNNGARSKSSSAQIRVRLPSDSSGIAGYSWVWTQNPYEMPPERFMSLPSQSTVAVTADQDDRWYFRVRAVDYAGNWSEPAEISYFRDTTPPKAPYIFDLDMDGQGFASSNNFNFSWRPDYSDDDVVGYSWNLIQLDSIPRRFATYANHPRATSDEETSEFLSALKEQHLNNLKIANPPQRILGANPSVSYRNNRNGLYAFSVVAIDSVGNIGEPSVMIAAMNKFIPFTVISSVQYKTSIFGDNKLNIFGQGFTYDGTIRQIYIDRDGQAPYDYTYNLSDSDYTVSSDTEILNLSLSSAVREGSYRIGLLHSDRGLYFSRNILTVEQSGTIKIEGEYLYEPAWVPITRKVFLSIQLNFVLLIVICVLALLGIVFCIKGIYQTAKESVAIRTEVQALLTGDFMALEKKKRLAVAKKRSGSLRIKMMAFTSLLVLIIVLAVSVVMGLRMVRTQGQTLAEGLENRISVLLNSMNSGARTYLPAQNVLELGYLPSQSDAISEAEFATITGLSASGNTEEIDFVWATNDSEISTKIDSSSINYGNSRLTDEDMMSIAKNCLSLNEKASAQIGEIASQISTLTTEGVQLAIRTDAASVARREEISTITTQLNSRVNQILTEISNENSSSLPVFDNTHLDPENTEYLFYKPVLYRQGNESNYVRGVVFLKVSTETLLLSIEEAQKSIIISALIVALIAVLAGSAGAFVLATVIVRPIKILEKHMALIGATRDKAKLADEHIVFKSNDEIGNLRDAVNTMTEELVRAAMEEQLALDGRAVQQAFLPLANTSDGGKATTSVLKDKAIEAFGYYEGASNVSGDYFDYKKLDDRWYVFIKCDASGHGVPAALIMTVVATFFRRYFENWSFKTNGTRLNELISQINDFIESLGLKGKFAAIILCLIDTQTGTVYMCNAGDNLVHVFDDGNKKLKILTLPEAPAAGPMPSFMVDMKGGFSIEKTKLKKGDILFLYTDGIEESTRMCRDATFNVIQKIEKDPNGNDKYTNVNELLEADRVTQIIEAVLNKQIYILPKEQNPVPGEVLQFDFTSCSGSIEEVITALISVEKIFRFYKPQEATVDNVVRVDRKIDTFLQAHFNLYNTYCGQKDEKSANETYVYYSNVMEDEQLDDLTLVAVRLQ